MNKQKDLVSLADLSPFAALAANQIEECYDVLHHNISCSCDNSQRWIIKNLAEILSQIGMFVTCTTDTSKTTVLIHI